jgi:tRNA(His) 5'-end guanylyltransferase
MKEYERRETDRAFLPTLPVYARIDGRCFSSITRGMARPFDADMIAAMVAATSHLVETTRRCYRKERHYVAIAPNYAVGSAPKGRAVK